MNTQELSQKILEILQKASNECGVEYVLGVCCKLSVTSINEPPFEENFQVVLCAPDDVNTLKSAYKEIVKENSEISAILGNAIQFVGVPNIK